ncbi:MULTISPECIES: hypothetical protein [Vibrio]|uniref:hypothetical protein n=1 Tax=Vibrio TaxID=662 RepID=UPI0013DE4FFA|nr:MULTISPECIES: hypothetical protein [Vibrio]NUW71570.1 hypothetical protein [Vibrio mediterranei]USE01266.1 hypothetical protein JKJ11_04100 [Vibrio sp. SCSIO 43133]
MKRILLVILLTFSAPSLSEVFDGFPDALVCEVGKPYRAGAIVLLVDYQDERKTVFYRSLDGTHVVKLDKKGLVSAVGRSSRNSCVGKTLSALISKGMVYSFTPFETK